MGQGRCRGGRNPGVRQAVAVTACAAGSRINATGAPDILGTADHFGGPMASPLLIRSPAKLNLTLDIVSRRRDGYHELVSLMCPIGLYDELRLTPAHGIEIACTHPGVPVDDTNLAHRAARAFFSCIGRGDGVRIDLTKRIPMGAGLGGGSGNAAAVLLALNRCYGEPLDRGALMALGRPLGADVPFFILGRPAVAQGVGERLAAVERLPPRWAVVVYPGFGISTRETYEGLCREVLEPNLALTKSENLHNPLLLKVRNGPPERYLHNDLEAVVLPHHPELIDIKRAMAQNGAAGTLMTGSGSCVFGLFSHPGPAETARQKDSGVTPWSVYAVPLLTDG